MKLVFDSSVVVDHLRTKKLSTTFFEAWKSYDIVLSLITVAELYSGTSVQLPGQARSELEDILSGADVITPSLDTAKRVGNLRSHYQLSLGDAFVAALALEFDVPVVALDRKAFTRVKGLRLYPL